ncbi:hypothetical protein Lser_V15G30270 [Lactuca serriola]
MKKPIIQDPSTDVKFHPNNLKLFNKKDEKDSFLKLSLPLFITFWLPFMISFSTFGLNHGNGGNVGVFSKNFTNLSSYPYLEDQGRNHTDRVLLELNISRVHNDSTSYEEETEGNPLDETTSADEVFWKVLGYSSFVCERQIQDLYLENRQEEVKSSRTHLTYRDLKEVTGAPSGLTNITHRLEPDGTKYNYAAASKGAKVVAHDKEAKGASNILWEDHDMYLRNPCSVPEKFVVIELAEETLIDAITIANFEHHSSNFKKFELAGSLVFPAESWYELGTFEAENVKHKQYFKLPEPKWARYVMLRLITHYGSEFYCTLSVFQAFGVDAIEKMLEDLIMASPESTERKLLNPNLKTDGELKNMIEGVDDGLKVPETVAKGNGRIHGDAVLKILMQKVRLLENNFLLLEEEINGVNMRHSDVVPHLEKEIAKYSGLVEETRSEIENLYPWKEILEKEIADLESWKASVSFLLESVVKENIMIRQELEKVVSDEESLDKTEHALLSASVSFTIVVTLKILSDRFSNSSGDLHHWKTRKADWGWKFLVLTCVITTIVTLTFC